MKWIKASAVEMIKSAAIAISLVWVGSASSARQLDYTLAEETAHLTPGPNIAAAEAVCGGCHSVDYIETQPPHKGEAFWRAEVTKMIKAFGAPVEPASAEKIIEYLTSTY
jgi:sulfite dehydrogenase (cytochrome) subunit B